MNEQLNSSPAAKGRFGSTRNFRFEKRRHYALQSKWIESLAQSNICFCTMSQSDLLVSNFAPFLQYVGYGAIRPFVLPHIFSSDERAKGLAVARDGKTLRVVLKQDGYHDRFTQQPNGTVRLTYVCGNGEEQRRQNKNRPGDQITVILDDKHGRYASPDSHAVLHGTFECIEATPDRKPNGTETLVPHSHIHIHGFETPTGRHEFDDILPPLVVKQPRALKAHHLILDSESAAPLARMRGDALAGFPMLQLAYERCNASCDEVLHAANWFLSYPDELKGSLGNDETSSVLKFDPQLLDMGDPAIDALRALLTQLRRVAESNGFLFAHNVAHDIRQIQVTAALLKEPLPNLRIRAIDTVKTAANFVPGAENRWLKLGDLAKLCGMTVHGLHRADVDVVTLREIVRRHFPTEALEPYIQWYNLQSTR